MVDYKKLLEQARKKGAAKDLTPTFMEFKKEGDSVIGKFINFVAVKSSLSEGTYNQYLFEAENGPIKFHLGSATDGEIAGQMVSGRIYHVEYKGKVKLAGGHTVNKFKVLEIDPTLAGEKDVPF